MRPIVIATLVALLAAAPVVMAQPAKDKRSEVMQRIRAMRAWQLTDALELDEPTAARLFPILARFDSQLGPMRVEGERLRKRLEAALAKGASDAVYRQLVAQIQRQHVAMQRWQQARFAAISKVLSPKQAAIALVTLPEIEARIRHHIRRAMEKKRTGVKNPFD